MGEVRAVDHHHRVRPRCNGEIHCLSYPAQDGGNGGHHLAQAHHRRGVQRIQAFQAFAFHGEAADAGEGDTVTRQRLEAGHQLGPQRVTGRLAAHQHQCNLFF